MKKYLLTPGPTVLPPFVQEALSRPIIHHRTPRFGAVLKEVEDGLKYIFQTKEPVFLIASSGTGAMEAAVANVASIGDTVITVEAGKFGERWTEIAAAYGLLPKAIKLEWGTALTAADVENALKNNPDAKAVFVTHCETSTGVDIDIKSIAKITQKSNALLVVDAISSMGVSPLKMDEWGVDIVVSGSQKGLMLPPGLGFIALSQRAWKWVEEAKTNRYYLDLRKYKKAIDKPDTPFTPAVGLIIAMKEVCEYYEEKGIENMWAGFEKLAKASRAAFESMGLAIFAKQPSNGVTAVKVPDGVDSAAMVKFMRDELGITMAGGQAQLKGKIFRMAHMGYIEAFDIITGVAAVEAALAKFGFTIKASGVSAAEKVLFG